MIIILSLLLVLLLSPFALIIGIIGGVIRYKNTPKPPPGLNKRQLEDYYNGGWKDYERIKEIDAQLKAIEDQEIELKINRDMETIAHLEQQARDIDMLVDMLEFELKRETDNKKRMALINRRMQLDNKRYTIQRKINNLLE